MKPLIILLLILTIVCCNNENTISDRFSFSISDTLSISIDERFLSEYYLSFDLIIKNNEKIFYGYNTTRNTLDQINLTSGKIMNFVACDDFNPISNSPAIKVHGSLLVVQGYNYHQLFKIDFESNCLKLIDEVDIKDLTNPDFIALPGGDIMLTPQQSPIWKNERLLWPVYANQNENAPYFLSIDLKSNNTERVPISLPKNWLETLETYKGLNKPTGLINENKLVFSFPFSSSIFEFDLNSSKLNEHSVPGIHTELLIAPKPSESQNLRTWIAFGTNRFGQLIWDEENKYYYRVEIKYDDSEGAENSIYFNRHFINIISESFQAIGTIQVPENCYAIPIPIDNKLYFMMRQNISEDQLMFVGVELKTN